MAAACGISSSITITPPAGTSRMSSAAVAGLNTTVTSRRPLRDCQPRSEMRTRYHVGSPAMLLGKRFFGATGTPMRKIVLARIVLLLALPEPLTVATASVKSLMTGDAMRGGPVTRAGRRGGRRVAGGC